MVRLEGSNPYVLLALLTVTKDPTKPQRGVARPPGICSRRVNGRHLQPQITTASSFLRMHLPGYVLQVLQKLPCSPENTSPPHSESVDLQATAVENETQELKDSPLLAALVQADGALRTLTQTTQLRATRPANPNQSQDLPPTRAENTGADAASAPAGTSTRREASVPASSLFAAVAASSTATCSSVFGDTAGSVILVDVKRQRAHTVSWGDTHGAHVTNALGHTLEAHVWQEQHMHGVTVRTASYGSMHGAHNFVLGTSGLWRYIHPSKAGLHAAAHANADVHLSTSEHQHDSASAVLRAALRTVVTRCAAAPAARVSVLNTLSQLNRLAPGSKSEAYRDRLVPRRRGDLHPDLTAAVASIVLQCSTSTSSYNRPINPPQLQQPSERSDTSFSTDSSAVAFSGASCSKHRLNGSTCGGGPMSISGSSAAQIEHMRHCRMCAFAVKHFHGEELLVSCESSGDHATTSESMESLGGELKAGEGLFLSAGNEASPDADDEGYTVSEASEGSQQTPAHACSRTIGSKTAWSVPEESTVSHAWHDRVQSGESCTRGSDEEPGSCMSRVATGAFSRTPRTPGKTLTVMKGMLHGSKSREMLAREGSGHVSLHAWSRSMSTISRSSCRTSSYGSFQKMMQSDRSEAQRRWALLARHVRLLALEHELRRSMWEAAVASATAAAAEAAADQKLHANAWNSVGVAEQAAEQDSSDEFTTARARTAKHVNVATSDSSSVGALEDAPASDAHQQQGAVRQPSSGCAVAEITTLSGEIRELGTSEEAPDTARAGRHLLATRSTGGGKPMAAAVGCRSLNVDSVGALAGPGAQSSMFDECSGMLLAESAGLFADVSMMGGVSILE